MIAAGDQLIALTTGAIESDQDMLWVSDGTAEGTRMVKDLSPVQPGTITGLTVLEWHCVRLGKP